MQSIADGESKRPQLEQEFREERNLAQKKPNNSNCPVRVTTEQGCLHHGLGPRKLLIMPASLSLLEAPCDLGTEVQNKHCQLMQEC